MSLLLALSLLNGVWEQDCFLKTRRVETIIDRRAVLEEIFYADDECTQPLTAVWSEGRIFLPEAAGEVRPIDFVFESVRLAAHSPEAVDRFSSETLCGIVDWRAGDAREVTGLECDFFSNGKPVRAPSAGDVRYGIFRLNGDRVQFGLLTPRENGLTPERRPTELDARLYRRKS